MATIIRTPLGKATADAQPWLKALGLIEPPCPPATSTAPPKYPIGE